MMRLTALQRWPELAKAPETASSRRLVEVGVGQDDQRVVAAELEHGAAVAQPLGDRLAHRDPAGERDDLDRGVGEERVEDLPPGRRRRSARGRRARRRRSSTSPRRSADSGVRSEGLSTIGAPAAIAGATLWATWLSGWLNGVIPATSRDRDAQRVGAAVAPALGDVAGERLAVVAQRLDGGEAEHVDGAAHLVAGVLEAEPGLQRDELGPLRALVGEAVGDGVEHPCALVARRRRAGARRGVEGLADLGGAAHRRLADELAAVRRGDRERGQRAHLTPSPR